MDLSARCELGSFPQCMLHSAQLVGCTTYSPTTAQSSSTAFSSHAPLARCILQDSNAGSCPIPTLITQARKASEENSILEPNFREEVLKIKESRTEAPGSRKESRLGLLLCLRFVLCSCPTAACFSSHSRRTTHHPRLLCSQLHSRSRCRLS